MGEEPSFGSENHYDPNQPRVPAGYPDGGQWTRIGGGAIGPRSEDARILSDVTPDNDWIPGAQYAAGGSANYIQHQKGVESAKLEYLHRGYSIVTEGSVAIDVPGFAGPRVYDFVVKDPKTGYLIGVEVKTTLYDTIRLDSDQVAKDVVVVRQGGTARRSNWEIRGVGYITYCLGCEQVDLRSLRLRSTLERFKIPFTHGGKPGETLP